MNQTIITPSQFQKYLNELVGQEVWEFYSVYETLTFNTGKKLKETSGIDKKPYYKGECQIHVWGRWKCELNGVLLQTNDYKKGEVFKEYGKRLMNFAKSIRPGRLASAQVGNHGKTTTLIFDSGYTFTVYDQKGAGYIGYSKLILNSKGEPIGGRHARKDDITGKLVLVEAP